MCVLNHVNTVSFPGNNEQIILNGRRYNQLTNKHTGENITSFVVAKPGMLGH